VLGVASRPRDRRAAAALRRRCANGSAPSARAGSAGARLRLAHGLQP